MLMDLFILDYIYRSGNQTLLPHFDTIHQIYIIKMKFLILFGILAMTLAASAQEDVSPPPVIEREEDMIEPPRLTEEEMRDEDEGAPEFPEEDDIDDRDVDEDGDEIPPDFKDM